jgi:hypothetical protein
LLFLEKKSLWRAYERNTAPPQAHSSFHLPVGSPLGIFKRKGNSPTVNRKIPRAYSLCESSWDSVPALDGSSGTSWNTHTAIFFHRQTLPKKPTSLSVIIWARVERE